MLTPDDIRGRKMVNSMHVDYSRPKGHAWIGTVEGLPRLGVSKGVEAGKSFVRWSVDGIPARDLEEALAVLNGLATIGPTLASPSGAGPYPSFPELLARAGRYDLITEAMWATFDELVERWRRRYVENIPKGRR